jgi:hypothetical protein
MIRLFNFKSRLTADAVILVQPRSHFRESEQLKFSLFNFLKNGLLLKKVMYNINIDTINIVAFTWDIFDVTNI